MLFQITYLSLFGPPPFNCGTTTLGPRQFNDLRSHDKNLDTSRTSAALETPGHESYLVWSCQQTHTHSSYSYLQDARIPMGWCREETQRREGVGVEKASYSIQQEEKKEVLEVQKRDGESLKKVQVEEKEEKAISADNWKAVIITEESREEERGWIRAVMGNTSEERRNVEAQLQAEHWGWVLERRVPLHTPRLSRSLFSLTHSRLSFSPSDRELSLAVVSLWPSPLSPTAGTWLDDTAQHCIAGEGRHQPPTHTHTQTNLTKTTLFSIPPLCLSITIALACYSTMLHLLIFARKHQCCSLLCNHQTLLIERQTFKLLDDSCNGEGIS